jgi:hypothetical protein
MPKQRGKFVLSSAEEEQLQQLIRAQSTPQGLAQRARVVQLAAQGMGVRAIGRRVGMHRNQVAKLPREQPRPKRPSRIRRPRPAEKPVVLLARKNHALVTSDATLRARRPLNRRLRASLRAGLQTKDARQSV